MSMNQLFELLECVCLTTVASFVAVRVIRPSRRSLHFQWKKRGVTVIDIDTESPKVIRAVKTIQTAFRKHRRKKNVQFRSSESVGRVLIYIPKHAVSVTLHCVACYPLAGEYTESVEIWT